MSAAARPASALRLAARALAVEPFHVMRLLSRAQALEASGRRILHLEVGEPDFPTPGPVVEAARRALVAGHTHYTPAAGLPALREAIAGYYLRRYQVPVDPGRILVTPGASGALQLAMLALLDPGDGVMIADPSYPCYRQVAALAGASPRVVAVGPASGYKLTRALAEQAWTPDIRVLLVASPSNPTGTVLSAQELADLYALCQCHGAALIVDEIYQGLVYEGVADHAALTLGDQGLFVVNSCSKYFGMTGWRLGWIVGPQGAAETLERLAQNLFIAPATLSQHAACAAFDDGTTPILEDRRQTLERRRLALLSGLRALEFRAEGLPLGAFYVYARLPDDVALDSMTYATRLLEEAGVAITPGADFGTHEAGRHVRFAYTRARKAIDDALDRIDGFRP